VTVLEELPSREGSSAEASISTPRFRELVSVGDAERFVDPVGLVGVELQRAARVPTARDPRSIDVDIAGELDLDGREVAGDVGRARRSRGEDQNPKPFE
jgi:hypothetical protein